MNKQLTIAIILAAGISLMGMNALAIHKGDLSCDPTWNICLQSDAYDAAETLHYVDSVVINGQYIDGLPTNPQLYIVDDNSNVILRVQSAPDIVIGKVSEPVGDDKMYAMSRRLILNPGFSMNLSIANGTPQTLCNETAVRFVYERHIYGTKVFTIEILNQNQLIGTITTTNLESEIAVHNSIIPCRNGR